MGEFVIYNIRKEIKRLWCTVKACFWPLFSMMGKKTKKLRGAPFLCINFVVIASKMITHRCRLSVLVEQSGGGVLVLVVLVLVEH